jgi:primosomal protein N' (replication factor Y)
VVQDEGPQSADLLRKQFTQIASLARKLEKAGWAVITHRPFVRDLLGNPLSPDPRPESLNRDQQNALASILPKVESAEFEAFLLHGVTGSGKTEIYLAACERALKMGRQALLLTPEIGICLRMESVLKSRFGAENVAVLHSGLTPAARRGQWLAIGQRTGENSGGGALRGVRPVYNPGVICVDEEQDEAYKQEDRLRYNARDLALLSVARSKRQRDFLGTATPSAATWHRAHLGEIGLVRLPKRVKQAALPKMELVDLRSSGKLKSGFLSPRLFSAIQQTVEQGNQAILFLNRRGFSPALICQACGKKVGCPACSLSLTLHKASARLVCHTCGHQRPVPDKCPHCGEKEVLKPLGLGHRGGGRDHRRESAGLAPGQAG